MFNTVISSSEFESFGVKETCAYCGQRLPFTTEYFLMCNMCYRIFCSVKCVKECGCGKNVCRICEEEIRIKYRTAGGKCRSCAQKEKGFNK